MRKALMTVIGIFALAGASPASATVIFTPGNNPQPGEQNILFKTVQTGTTVNGFTNITGTMFTFSSTQTLFTDAHGAAEITSTGTENTSALTNIDIKAASGFAFTDFIFNLMKGSSNSATATVTADFNGTNLPPSATNPDTSFPVNNGGNFLTITTAGGEFFNEIKISMNGSDTFESFKQPRVSGLCTLGANNTTCTTIPTPEPTTLSLLGIGLVGLGLAGRRKRRRRAA
jgi:hypothetical protein